MVRQSSNEHKAVKMKKKLLIALIFFTPFFSNAQDTSGLGTMGISMETIRITATMIGMFLLAYFIIVLIRTILDYRLRSKLISKGVSDEVVRQFLKPADGDARMQVLKWALLLAGLGLGLILVQMAKPYGIHSLAIIVLSISISLIVYYFLMKKNPQ